MNWSPWYRFNRDSILSAVPKQPGVYAFRQGTEIIYYGRADDLEARMLQHLNDETDSCLARAASQGMEMQWDQCANPVSEEMNLLIRYQAAYHRLPRCNNRIG